MDDAMEARSVPVIAKSSLAQPRGGAEPDEVKTSMAATSSRAAIKFLGSAQQDGGPWAAVRCMQTLKVRRSQFC
jgi:hypothetical protein